MSHAFRLFVLLLLLQGLSLPAQTHMAREDVNGCHYEQGEHHCHDQQGDAGEFLAFLATIGILGYFLCDRVVACGDSDIPEVPPQVEADY